MRRICRSGTPGLHYFVDRIHEYDVEELSLYSNLTSRNIHNKEYGAENTSTLSDKIVKILLDSVSIPLDHRHLR